MQLNQTVTKPWVKSLVSAFSRLYEAEGAAKVKNFHYTKKIKPLIDYLLDRIKLQMKGQFVSLSSKVVI